MLLLLSLWLVMVAWNRNKEERKERWKTAREREMANMVGNTTEYKLLALK